MSTSENNTVYLPLENVESEHCALIVDKGLSKIKGITEHKVELNNNRAVIQSSDLLTSVPKAVKKIRDLGYDVITVKKTYPVLNMTCASCASSTQRILESQPGVLNAVVNYANATVNVEFVPTITNAQQLKISLQGIGYDLMIDESEEAKESLEELQDQKYILLRNKTLGAIVLSIPLIIIGMFFTDVPYANYMMWLLATPV